MRRIVLVCLACAALLPMTVAGAGRTASDSPCGKEAWNKFVPDLVAAQPVPVLDGGAIFLLLIEGLLALIGLSISTAVRDRIQQVGFVMVLLLLVFVISNDFLKLIGGNHESEEKPPATAPAK